MPAEVPYLDTYFALQLLLKARNNTLRYYCLFHILIVYRALPRVDPPSNLSPQCFTTIGKFVLKSDQGGCGKLVTHLDVCNTAPL